MIMHIIEKLTSFQVLQYTKCNVFTRKSQFYSDDIYLHMCINRNDKIDDKLKGLITFHLTLKLK